MTRRTSIAPQVCALAIAALLSACGGSNHAPPATASSVPATQAGWAGRAGVGQAIELLNKGDAAGARKRLTDVLQRTPGDTVATTLLKQIDTEPTTLFGQKSFAYVARGSDTMSTLAGRFLGNPMLFYGLARYNHMAPDDLAAGKTLRIPGEEPASLRPQRTPSAPQRPTEPKPRAVVAAPPPPAPAKPSANPARAAQLRAAGLEQMNRGAIDGAVGLLSQASRFDPGNMLIRRDLDRALRIRQAVKTKR